MNTAAAPAGRLLLAYPRPPYPLLRALTPLGWIGAVLVAMIVLLSVLAPWIAPYNPFQQNLSETLQLPSAQHWLGTDEFGRDVLSRILHGGLRSQQVAAGAVLLGVLIGVPMGLLGGYFGGRWDAFTMRALDVFLAFPGILLAIAIVSVLGPGLTNLTIAVGIYSVPVFARLVRSVALQVRNLEYVEAARALGASNRRIIAFHVFPATLTPLLVVASLRVAVALLTASGLSFLGIGVPPSEPEWGAMLSNGQTYVRSSPHVAIFPGLAIMITVIAFNLLADALREKLDPRSEFRGGRIGGGAASS